MKRPNIINSGLLWEYDLETFNYEKSYKIVIERILQMGNLEEWRSMVKFYSREQILETIEWSAQLDKRDKDFSRFFLDSEFLTLTKNRPTKTGEANFTTSNQKSNSRGNPQAN